MAIRDAVTAGTATLIARRQGATQSLIAAYANNKTIVDESTARIAVAEVTAERCDKRCSQRR